MSVLELENFPMVNQNTQVTSDGRPSNNAQEDCVAASICAACMWLNGIKQVGGVYTPDNFKDKAYDENYTGPTSATKYVNYCQSLGIKLWPLDGEYSYLISQAHVFLARGLPVIFTQEDWIVDTSLPDYQGWTHVACWYADSPGTLTSMDPWGGFPRMKSDQGWAQVLRAKQIWIAERIETDMVVDLTIPIVASFFEAVAGNSQQWKCKQTGKVIQYGILDYYRSNGCKPYCGLSSLGLPKSDEIPVAGVQGAVKQFFERGVLCYDPGHKIDNPPGAGDVYALQLYNDGPGTDPAVGELQQEIMKLQEELKKAPVETANPILQTKLDSALARLNSVKNELANTLAEVQSPL